MKLLTDKQRAILDYAEANRKIVVKFPTIRAMAKHFGITKSAIADHIRALKRKRAWPN